MPQLIKIVRPLNGPSYFTTQPTLEGTTYTLQFLWNEREGFWYMTILDVTASVLVAADAKLVVNSWVDALLAGRSPPGLFVAFDTGNTLKRGVEVGYDDLGNRVQLLYFTQAELQAAQTGP